MPVKRSHIINAIIVIGFLFFAKVILDVPPIREIWTNYPDPQDYQNQSRRDLFSKDFFVPVPAKWFTPRPFTIPLMYKLVGSDPIKMFMFQKLFFCFCVFAFILSVNRFLKKDHLKIISAYLFLFFFTWWNIVGWSNNILSESISFSFFILWLAILFAYYRNKNVVKLSILILTSLLLSFTRDTWPYLILFFFTAMLILDILLKAKRRSWSYALVVFSIVLYLFQSYTVKEGERSVLPVFNTLAGRIAKNEEHLKWFAERGMPQSAQLREDFKEVDVDSRDGRYVIYKRYYDSTYTELFNWVKYNGKSTYQKFLLTHFQYLILNDQTLAQLQRIFAYNTYSYYQKPYKFFHNANNVFPVFNIYVALFMVLTCIYFWYRSKEFYLLFPALVSLVLFANVYISYNADTMEVERHLYLTAIGIELTSLLSLVFIANYAIENGLFKNVSKYGIIFKKTG